MCNRDLVSAHCKDPHREAAHLRFEQAETSSLKFSVRKFPAHLNRPNDPVPRITPPLRPRETNHLHDINSLKVFYEYKYKIYKKRF